ncbi:YjzD family protein [Ectobacillus funiculus]|uniref:YjzD family protein n=1 Tax=Ectobacillus funiculus TaxID=137993 RepID=A0ABV5WPQ4_9BACI
MRLLWTFIWSFLLMQMMSYIISSMTGSTYDFGQATIMSVVVTVLIFIISAILPNEPAGQHH